MNRYIKALLITIGILLGIVAIAYGMYITDGLLFSVLALIGAVVGIYFAVLGEIR